MLISPVSSRIFDSFPPDQSDDKKIPTMIYLNVYDLTPINNYLYWFGHGIFHSGIEVHGSEYGFGAHDFPVSGVFEVEPKTCPGFTFRRSIPLGCTDMSRAEFMLLMERLSNKYHGDTYHLLFKNCNHFTDDVCQRVTGKPIPGWVNRMARLGSYCSCLLPEAIKSSAVGNIPEAQICSEDGASCGSMESKTEDVHQMLLTRDTNIEIVKDRPMKLQG